MSVRAKFKVASVTKTTDGTTAILHPVTSGSTENEQFFKYTPGGQITLSTINPAAGDQFELNKEFYVDFTPADRESQTIAATDIGDLGKVLGV